MTSEFWADLASDHERGLSEHGLTAVKRVQALRYFTWRWRTDELRANPQSRYLLRHVSPLVTLRAALTPVDLADASWAPAIWARSERWVFAVASRLAWEVALRHGSPAVTALAEPLLGDPFPVTWRGRLISQDLANTALEVGAMQEALEGRAPARILEVGAGYGRTAFGLLSTYPGARYTIVDIPPALDISRWYLTSLFPDRDLTFVDGRADEPEGPYDLILTISSLAEMPIAEAARYLAMFGRLASQGATVYLKQWERWHNPADLIDYRFDDSAPPDGRRIFRRRAPIQTAFLEGAWRMP